MTAAARRRPRDAFESDQRGVSTPDMIPSSQPDLSASKRPRLSNGSASPSLNAHPPTKRYHPQSSVLQRQTMRSRGGQQYHQPGSIVRVKLANFVTYTAVELFPGPSLNMVIGPNGTGKSTLVCAICLGLGWGPQHLGRAKEVSEYVKHGCQEAMIEIELAKDGKRFEKNIVIRCNIKREGNKTVFSVDGKPQGKKTVMELARSLSIQIDNLCQFLPQDKVVEFAALTPVELLRSTQRAVASQEMISMHEQLKDLRRKQKDVQATCASDQDSLTNLEGRQRLQEADVERMREREQVVKKISYLEAARPFAAYRTARLIHKEARDKKKDAQDELTKLQNEVEPSMRALNEKQRYKGQIEVIVRERKDGIAKAGRRADNVDKKFLDLQDKHNESTAEFIAEKNAVKKHRQEIARVERLIDTLKRQMEEQPSELDVQAFNERIREKRRNVQNCRDQIEDLQRKQTELVQRGKDRKFRIQQAEENLARLDSQTGKQNIKLQAVSSDSAKLWNWVQQHQQEFDRPVLGPPLVECSVKDLRYLDQIEALIQKTTMLGITARTNDDFRKLSDAAANLRVSEVYLKTMKSGLDDFPPPVNSDEMKRFGFDFWALDLLDGPEPVLTMLCGEQHLHQTGIAIRDTTTQQYDILQDSPIAAWVTGKSSYRISRRREYGPGATSTQVKAIRKATIWTEQPVDITAKREMQENITCWTEEVEAYNAQIKEAQTKILAWRESIQTASNEEKELSAEKAAKQKAIGEFKALPTKLAANEEKLATSQGAMSGIKDRLAAIADRQDQIAMQRAQIALDYADAVEVLRVHHNSLHEAEIMLIEAISDFEILKERNRSVQELLESQRAVVDDFENKAREARVEATRLLGEIQNLMSGEPELVAFLRELGDGHTTEALETEIDSEKARLELMHEGNGGVIKEYEARQKKIGSLTSRLQEIKSALSELDDKIKELRDLWEPELHSLVKKISDSFSFNMEQISCAGEVGIHKDDDFDQWAIQIRVKFRENEPLTTLDSHRQSGGERAVSTIFYLMSLQSLTCSPFRVVDEINQGMDPRNERLVHKRMVGIACGNNDIRTNSHTNSHRDADADADDEEVGRDKESGSGGSQYFLITPKLLHNLTYERGMRVLCIASGEYMPVDRSRVDFKGCVDLMRGLKAGCMRVTAAG